MNPRKVKLFFSDDKVSCYFYIQMADDYPEDTPKISDKIICELCGEKFSCGAKIGKCWCFDIEVKAKTLAELRENFDKCLCENCLGKLAANNTNSSNKIVF